MFSRNNPSLNTPPLRFRRHQNDFLIGEMIHDMVTELGYRVTHVAHRFGSALREISKENFDGALVNIGIDADM